MKKYEKPAFSRPPPGEGLGRAFYNLLIQLLDLN
jgi:hypothetical protein